MGNGFRFQRSGPRQGRGDGGRAARTSSAERPRADLAIPHRLARRARERFEVEREIVRRVEALSALLEVAHDALGPGEIDCW
jgi:hypothetical protein